jgi:hypothetical protein
MPAHHRHRNTHDGVANFAPPAKSKTPTRRGHDSLNNLVRMGEILNEQIAVKKNAHPHGALSMSETTADFGIAVPFLGSAAHPLNPF